MRTARSLTVSPSMLCVGGVYLVPGGVPGPGGCTWSRGRGVYLVPGQGGIPGPGGVYLVQGVPGPGVHPPGPGTPRDQVYLVLGVYWGVYLVLGGVPGPGGYLVLGGVSAPGPRGVSAPGLGGCQVLPPVNRMTDACKNITLPHCCNRFVLYCGK